MALTGQDVTGRELVIFDFDGTLANSTPGIVKVARQVLNAHGLSDEELGDLRRLVGPPFPQAFSMVYGLSSEEAEQVTEEYRAIYKDLGLEGWPLYDGMAELLAALRESGRTLAVASSKRTELLVRALDDNGVTESFDLICGKQDDYADTKPKTIARVLDALGRTPEEAVMVGDRHFDVEAAAACGLPCAGVRYGETCPRGELEDAGACAVAETIDELGLILMGPEA